MSNRFPLIIALLAAVGSTAGSSVAWAQAKKPTTPPVSTSPTSPPASPATEHPARTGPEVDLRPRFVNGRLTRYEMSIVSGNKLTSSDEEGINQDQTMTQTIDLSVKVKSVDDDGATLEIVYDRIRASLETDDFKASFDSRDTKKPAVTPTNPTTTTPTPRGTTPKTTKPVMPPAKPAKPGKTTAPAPASTRGNDPEMDELLGQIMRPMVGTTLTMQVDKQGNIKSVSGGDALGGAGLAAGLGSLLGGGGMTGGTPSVGGSGGSPMNWVVNSPGQKSIVHVGETWTNTDSLGGTPIGGFKMITRHTCNSVTETGGGKAANLTFSGRADQESLGNPSATGFTLKETAYKGDYAWDLVKGELKSMTSTLRTVIEGKLTAATTKMTADTRTTVKRLD